MNEDFRKRMELYSSGKLSHEEEYKVERDIKMLEQYQCFLDEKLKEEGLTENHNSQFPCNFGLENRIIRKAKWKARIQNALIAVLTIIVGYAIFIILTSLYYFHGEPNRYETYEDVVSSAVATTQPNITAKFYRNSVGPFFTVDMDFLLYKQVGGENIQKENLSLNWVFSRVNYRNQKILSQDGENHFIFPGSVEDDKSNSGWYTLEKLPEGTVAEAFLSFDKCYSIDEVLQKFEGKNIKPVWFAVDTGLESNSGENNSSAIEPVGFPYINCFGSGKISDNDFINTLYKLNKHKEIVEELVGPLAFDKRISYVENNGVRIYGTVVTGPSKEILNIKNEPWITGVSIGETRLWNWDK